MTIRLDASDVEAARRRSEVKGMPCQTYIKGVLHEALLRKAKLVPVRARKA